MDHVTEWTMRLYLFEHDDVTTARAVLDTGSGVLQAAGQARRNPHDRPVPEIGDELAAGRALAKLSARLLRAAEVDVRVMAGQR